MVVNCSFRVIRSFKLALIKSTGYSLLEFTLTVPVLLLFVLGAIDLNSSIQAYTALQEGVRSAVRCSTSTDGDCIQTAANVRDPLYNYVLYNGDSGNQYFGNIFYYGGTEKFLRAPIYRLENFRARQLTTATYSLNGGGSGPQGDLNRTATRLYFEAEGEHLGPMMLTSFGPRVRVTRAVGQTPAITVKYNRHNGRHGDSPDYNFNDAPVYTRVISLGGPAVTINEPSGTGSATVNFTIPAPNLGGNNANGQCRESDKVGAVRSAAHAPTETGCSGEQNGINYRTHASVVVYVEASTSVPNSGSSEFNVDISVNGQGLGGRHAVSSPGMRDGSLCPRGVLDKHLEGESGCDETSIYRNLKVPVGQSIPVKLTVRKHNGAPLTWDIRSVRVYYPEFKPAPKVWKRCESNLLPSQINRDADCYDELGKKARKVKAINPNNQPHNFASSDTPFVLGTATQNTTGPTPANCSEVATALGTSTSSLRCEDYFELSSGPGSGGNNGSGGNSSTQSFTCRASNTGKGININGAVVNKPLAISDCGIPSSLLNQMNQNSLVFNSRLLTFPHIAPITWQPNSCQDNTKPVPAEVTRFYSNTHSTTPAGHSAPIYLGANVDPDEAIETPPYSCTRWGSGYESDSEIWNNETREEQFFKTAQYEYTVGCDDDSWKRKTREEAVAAGLNSNAYFEPTKKTVPDEENENGSGGVGYVSQAVYQQYSSQCNMTFAPGQPDDRQGVILGSCDSNQVPAECLVDGQFCVKQFAGFCGDNSTVEGSLPNGQSVSQVAAESYFYGRLASNYPRAKRDCEGSNCASIRSLNTTSNVNGHQTVGFEGQITTPLILSRVFGQDNVTFTYSDQRTLEAEIAR